MNPLSVWCLYLSRKTSQTVHISRGRGAKPVALLSNLKYILLIALFLVQIDGCEASWDRIQQPRPDLYLLMLIILVYFVGAVYLQWHFFLSCLPSESVVQEESCSYSSDPYFNPSVNEFVNEPHNIPATNGALIEVPVRDRQNQPVSSEMVISGVLPFSKEESGVQGRHELVTVSDSLVLGVGKPLEDSDLQSFNSLVELQPRLSDCVAQVMPQDAVDSAAQDNIASLDQDSLDSVSTSDKEIENYGQIFFSVMDPVLDSEEEN